MAIVFFDLDGTLLPRPGAERQFLTHLLRRGRIGPQQLTAAARFTLRFGAHFGRAVFKKNKGYLCGLAVGQTAKMAQDFANATLCRQLYPDLVDQLRQHQRQADPVVLLTGSPQFLADPIAAHLEIEFAIATLCAVENGRFQPGPPARHPLGPEKLRLARRFCAARDATLADAVAYADAGEDAPLLAAVGRAVAVRPDRRLRRLAETRAWQILEPGSPGSGAAGGPAMSLAGVSKAVQRQSRLT